MSGVCADCGHSSIVDMLVPNPVWQAISRGAYCLCPNCMNERMAALGIRCEGIAHCHGVALRSPMTAEQMLVARAWRASPQEVQSSGSVGNPLMDRLFPAVSA